MKGNHPRVVLAGLLASAMSMSLAAQAPSSRTYDLRYRLAKDARFSVTNTTEYANFTEVDGRLQKMRTTLAGMVLDYRVSSVEADGSLNLEVTYRNRNRTIEEATGAVTPIDFANLLGGRFTYRLDTRGEVSQLAGFDKLDVRVGYGKEWSRDQLKAEIEHLFPSLPDHPVRMGDTWQTKIAEGPDTDTIEYRLTGEARVNGVDCVRFIARYWTDTDRSATEAGRTFALKGRTIGNDIYYFAVKEGMLMSRVSTGQADMEVTEAGKPARRTHREEMYETRIALR